MIDFINLPSLLISVFNTFPEIIRDFLFITFTIGVIFLVIKVFKLFL